MTEANPRTVKKTMLAIRIGKVTPARDAHLAEVPVPKTRDGWIRIKVRGIGLNHSEQVLRLGEVERDYIAKPVIPGIECVGEVDDPGTADLKVGQRVWALMGGMGRSFDGSYAEYALVPARHVFALPPAADDLPWETLAAIPETFFTAWGSLFECLHLEGGDTLLVRGGTSALGYAAIQIAHALGCRTIATARHEEGLELLMSLGCDRALVDDGNLSEKGIDADKALELVGPSTLRDSLKAVRRGGIVCDTGILGGAELLQGFDPITEIPNGVFLTGFYSNYPDQGTITDIFEFIAYHGIEPVIAARFGFGDLAKAIALQDRGGFHGKIVVTR